MVYGGPTQTILEVIMKMFMKIFLSVVIFGTLVQDGQATNRRKRLPQTQPSSDVQPTKDEVAAQTNGVILLPPPTPNNAGLEPVEQLGQKHQRDDADSEEVQTLGQKRKKAHRVDKSNASSQPSATRTFGSLEVQTKDKTLVDAKTQTEPLDINIEAAAATAHTMSQFLNVNSKLLFELVKAPANNAVLAALCTNHAQIVQPHANKCYENGHSPISYAICSNNLDAVQSLLKVTKLDTKLWLDNQLTFYAHLACKQQNQAIFETVIAAVTESCPAALTLKDAAGLTVAHLAIKLNKLAYLAILLQYEQVLMADLIDYLGSMINSSLFAEKPNQEAFKLFDLLIKTALHKKVLDQLKPFKNITNKAAQDFIVQHYSGQEGNDEAQAIATALEESRKQNGIWFWSWLSRK